MMSGKAQLSQAFVFLAAVIVIISTIYVGMRLFWDFKGAGCDTIKAGFMQDVKDTIDESSTFGSRSIKKLRPTCDARLLCFLDSTAIGDASKTSGITDESLKTSAESGVKTNIFLRDDVGLQPIGYDERITVSSPYFLCINQTQGFVFKTEGKGNSVIISSAR